MRKISTGVTGGPILGTLSVSDNTISSVQLNNDITLDPNGTGSTKINSNLQINDGNNLILADNDSSNFIAFSAPATVSSNTTYVFPEDGTADYVLGTDGAGNLSWIQVVVEVTNQVADGATYYPLLSTSTSGSIGGVNTSNTKLSFVPNTGTLSCTAVSATNVTASGALQGGTITETSSIALKENITPLDNALDTVLNLAAKIYDRKDGSSKNEPGLIAEEVETVAPNLVVKDENGNPQSIMYSRLGAYFVEAIKELKREIDILKENK